MEWIWIPLTALLCIFLIYMLLPHLWSRRYAKHVVRHVLNDPHCVALSFDDGPDPVYTLQLLEILDRYQARASFFVQGERVRAYPQVAQEILRRGHTLGMHMDQHRHAWLLTPWGTRRQIFACRQAIMEATGHAAYWLRPPWGGFNLALNYMIQRLHIRVAFWSAEVEDWNPQSPEELLRKLESRVEPGTILLLHDHHHKQADTPAVLLAILPKALEGMKAKGYRFISLDEMELKHR